MRISKIFFGAFASVILSCAGSRTVPEYLMETSCGERSLLWKASKNGVPDLWLLGSVHLADSSFYPFPSVIDSALEASTLVAAELDIQQDSTAARTALAMAAKGKLPAGVRLGEVLPESLNVRVDSLTRAWNIPREIFETFRPWMVAVSLSAVAIERSGLSADYGIDQEILLRAEDLGKKIFSIETPESQIDVFAGESDSLGIEYLASTLDEISEADSLVRGIATAWKCGNVPRLRALLDSDSDVYEEGLYVRRNVRMAAVADSLAQAHERAFIVIGAAHLVGSGENVLVLLEKMGYQIERR